MACQKDSGSTGENGTQVKPVVLAVKTFAVYIMVYWVVEILTGVFKISDSFP